VSLSLVLRASGSAEALSATSSDTSPEMADSEWLEDLSDGVPGDDMPMDRQRAVVICANPQAAKCLAHENYSYPPGRDGVAVKSY